jgi:hypothetical protein
VQNNISGVCLCCSFPEKSPGNLEKKGEAILDKSIKKF